MPRPALPLLAVAAMTLIVLASNVLVQFPVSGRLGALVLGDLLTWGAFTYPFAFLVTDVANRLHGPVVARRVVYAGFASAVFASVLFPPLLFALGLLQFETAGDRLARIALASGSAFLAAQLLDITVFNRLRRTSWWKAPAASSLAGSVLDTLVFFTIAFAPFFVFAGPNDGFALEPAPFLGLFPGDAPRWVSWAIGDFSVKLLIAVFCLVPYRIIVGALLPVREGPANA